MLKKIISITLVISLMLSLLFISAMAQGNSNQGEDVTNTTTQEQQQNNNETEINKQKEETTKNIDKQENTKTDEKATNDNKEDTKNTTKDKKVDLSKWWGRGRKDTVGMTEKEVQRHVDETLEVKSINGKKVDSDDFESEADLDKEKLTPKDIVKLNQTEKQDRTFLDKVKSFLSITAHAAEPVVSITPGTSVHYGGWSTCRFDIGNMDGSLGFCAQPNSGTPSGNFTAYKLNNDLIKCLVLGFYGGYGINDNTPFDLNPTGYATVHAMIGMVYSGQTTGLSPAAIAMCQAQIDDYAGQITSGQAYGHLVAGGVDTGIDIGDYDLWYAPNSAQDIVWLTDNPKGILKLKKTSLDTNVTNGNKCYSLKDTTYKVYSDSGCTTEVGTLVCDENGNTNEIELKAGTYYIKETKAGKGFALINAPYTVTVKAGETTTKAVADPPQADPVDVLLGKLDKEHYEATGDKKKSNKPVEGATLQGAEYTFTYYDNTERNVSGTPLKTWVFKTDSDGYINPRYSTPISGDPLYKDSKGTIFFPIGTYKIVETKAPNGYVLDPTERIVTVLGENNVVAENGDTITAIDTYNEGNDEVLAAEQVSRGDISFTKTSNGEEAMGNCPFLVTNKETGECHVIVTDKNGYYNSRNYANTNNTNKNDEACEMKDGKIVSDDYSAKIKNEDLLSYKFGTWFSEDESGKATEAKSGVGSYPHGTYIFQELRAKANEGHNLIRFTAYVDVDGYKIEDNETISLGTKDDKILDVQTNAYEKGTHNKNVKASKECHIIDALEYSNFDTKTEYTFKTTLHYRNENGEDAGIVKNDKGEDIIVETKHTPKKRNDRASTEIVFNANENIGKEIVIFEDVYIGDTHLYEHHNINDEYQTIKVDDAKLTSKASIKENGKQEIILDGKDTVTLQDTVTYESLPIGQDYILKTTVVDKKTGKVFTDKTGKRLIKESSFKTENSGGDLEVSFKDVNVKDINELELVFFESIYKRDIPDFAEGELYSYLTCNYSKKLSEDNINKFIDYVYFKKLDAEKEYTVVSHIVNQETSEELGFALKNIINRSDGMIDLTIDTNIKMPEKVASYQYVYEGKYNNIDDIKSLEPIITHKDLTNNACMVGEDVVDTDKLIKAHEDLNDKDQTIKMKVKENVEAVSKVQTFVKNHIPHLSIILVLLVGLLIFFIRKYKLEQYYNSKI